MQGLERKAKARAQAPAKHLKILYYLLVKYMGKNNFLKNLNRWVIPLLDVRNNKPLLT